MQRCYWLYHHFNLYSDKMVEEENNRLRNEIKALKLELKENQGVINHLKLQNKELSKMLAHEKTERRKLSLHKV